MANEKLKIAFEDITKIINCESERLSKLVEEQKSPMASSSGNAGYIVGIAQLRANLHILLGNRQSAGNVPICWKCANVLETDNSKDHSDEPVKICCECGAFIRD